MQHIAVTADLTKRRDRDPKIPQRGFLLQPILCDRQDILTWSDRDIHRSGFNGHQRNILELQGRHIDPLGKGSDGLDVGVIPNNRFADHLCRWTLGLIGENQHLVAHALGCMTEHSPELPPAKDSNGPTGLNPLVAFATHRLLLIVAVFL